MNDLEEEYTNVVNDVMKHVMKVKESGIKDSLIDIIMDYCIKNELDVDLVGDAIHSDVYFKSFIQRDCEQHKIFKSDAPEDW